MVSLDSRIPHTRLFIYLFSFHLPSLEGRLEEGLSNNSVKYWLVLKNQPTCCLTSTTYILEPFHWAGIFRQHSAKREIFFFFGVDFVVSWLIDFGGRFHSPPCLTVAFPKYFLAKPTNRIFWNTCVTERIVCFCLSYSIDLLLQEFLLYFGNPSANGINGFSLGEFHWEPRDNILGFVFLG